MDDLPPGLEILNANNVPWRTAEVVGVVKTKRAVELRAAGWTYGDIADDLGMSVSWVRELIKRALRDNVSEVVDDMRLIDGARLEQVIGAIWDRCLQGDLRAIDRLIMLLERKAKLFGLDQPVEINAAELRASLFGVLKQALDAETYERVLNEMAS